MAAERSDWSMWMNLSSLHALAEQHLIQTAEEFESVPHQHTKDFKPQRAAHIQQEKRAREKREQNTHFFIYLFTSSKRGNAIDKHEIGDVDAHRLRCRHGGVYIRQNAGTASLSMI